MSETNQPAKPYKGLIPYSEQDALYFFGREQEQKVITANLMASRLTLLYGASGVGKSSVLRAGVAHNLEKLAEQNPAALDTPEFIGVSFSSWQDDPTSELLNHVHEAIKRAVSSERSLALKPATLSLDKSLGIWSEQADTTLLIILDQFEEYLLYHPKNDDENSFARQLARAVNNYNLRANFIISIREDALAKLDLFREYIPNLFDNYLRVDHLDYDSAQRAILKPIEQYNKDHNRGGQEFSVEPELVAEVLDQVKTGQIVLSGVGQGVIKSDTKVSRIETPYLQIVMTRLWDEEMQARSKVLRLETLKQLGGASKIIRTHLDAALEEIKDDQQIAFDIFHYLVTPSGTKIAHKSSDLADYCGRSNLEIQRVLEKLSSGNVRILRSVPPPADKPDSENLYEIFHDVLAPAILDWRVRYELRQKNAEVKLILSKKLEKALEGLNKYERDIAALILPHLITPDRTRAIVHYNELATLSGVPFVQVLKVVTQLSAPDKEILHPVALYYAMGTYYQINQDLLIEPILEWCYRYGETQGARLDAARQEKPVRVGYVDKKGILSTWAYYAVLALLAVYSLYSFFTERDGSVNYLFWTFSISDGVRLLVIAFLSGLLGGLMSSSRSFNKYVGNRVVAWRSMPSYLFWPFGAGVVGLMLCLVLVGGVLKDPASVKNVNIFSFVILPGLSGLFFPQFSKRLREIFTPALEATK